MILTAKSEIKKLNYIYYLPISRLDLISCRKIINVNINLYFININLHLFYNQYYIPAHSFDIPMT